MESSSDNFLSRTLSDGQRTKDVCVKIINSPRSRNYCVRIVSKNTISITKPTRASLKGALEFLDGIAEWVLEKLENVPQTYSLREWMKANPKVYVGESEWTVRIAFSRTRAFFVEDEKNGEVVFCVPDVDNNSNDPLLEAFKKFATDKISARLSETASRAGIEYSAVTVRDQSGRWGSRSSSGRLSLNWRIVFLPPELQNYIICHELAHVRFMDHSVSFWIWLNSFCPRAKRLDRELTKVSSQLFRIEFR